MRLRAGTRARIGYVGAYTSSLGALDRAGTEGAPYLVNNEGDSLVTGHSEPPSVEDPSGSDLDL